MKIELLLHRLLPIVSILAALGPGISVWRMFRAREVVETMTQYGELPQIHVPVVDYVTFALVIVLFIAALLEAIRCRVAAPIILVTSLVLWIHYIPVIWDEVTGTMWFATKLGRTLSVTWQMLTVQLLTMLIAAVLTFVRVHRSVQ